MDGQVAESVKRERLERLLDLQRSITLEKNESLIGTTQTVLVDRVEGADETAVERGNGGGAVGRTARQALEVDGEVYIEDARGARAGHFVDVHITGAFDQDLAGTIADAH
jgi:ribosomal protein S12 methylthiotransferase